MEYGCIGEHLPHSFSREIHEKLGGYGYALCEVRPGALGGFLMRADFRAINVTIPYKERVMPYLARISDTARAVGAVNTIVNRDGVLEGYNTDYEGMRALAARCGIDFRGKNVTILGTGGTSKTALAVVRDAGANSVVRVSRTGREGAIGYDALPARAAVTDILINTTPVGMYPDPFPSPVSLAPFVRLSGVLDAVYNPLRTTLVLEARARGIPAAGGLYMLAAQAAAASELFTGEAYPADTYERVWRAVQAEKENIVLIGMPSAGKTTVGAALARRLGRRFIDTDAETARRVGMAVPDFIRTRGIDAFREAEAQTVRAVAPECGAVIAVGGGTILREENVTALRHNGRLLWLRRSLSLLHPSADRPLSDSKEKLRELEAERTPLFRAAADGIIDGDAGIEETAEAAVRLWESGTLLCP